jgi:hypothetical protein
MSKVEDDIKNELGKYAEQFAPASIITAVVKSINSDETIIVTTGSGLEIDDVRLRSVVRAAATKIVITPADNSTVLIGKIENSDEYVVVAVDEVAKVEVVFSATISIVIDANGITMNGGSLDGLVKLGALLTKLNAVEDDLNALKTVFKTSWVVVPSDGGAALKTAAATWANGIITKTVKADLENPKIKQ